MRKKILVVLVVIIAIFFTLPSTSDLLKLKSFFTNNIMLKGQVEKSGFITVKVDQDIHKTEDKFHLINHFKLLDKDILDLELLIKEDVKVSVPSLYKGHVTFDKEKPLYKDKISLYWSLYRYYLDHRSRVGKSIKIEIDQYELDEIIKSYTGQTLIDFLDDKLDNIHHKLSTDYKTYKGQVRFIVEGSKIVGLDFILEFDNDIYTGAYTLSGPLVYDDRPEIEFDKIQDFIDILR